MRLVFFCFFVPRQEGHAFAIGAKVVGQDIGGVKNQAYRLLIARVSHGIPRNLGQVVGEVLH
jgi:hypothetical protein